jgi:glycosyltransferase involved in cell wall biosynthesis
MRQGISIVICCYNSASRLPKTLMALAQQEVGDVLWEIVLVDNASSDNTKTIARQQWLALKRANVELRIVDETNPGLSFARRKGVYESRFNYVIFCDDDNHLFPNYIADSFSIINGNEEIGALGGIGIALADKPLPEWFEKYKFCFACYAQGSRDGELVDPMSSLFGAGMVVRKSILLTIFSMQATQLLTDRSGTMLSSGGDTELCYSIRLLGFKLWFSSALKFYHYLPPSRLTQEYLVKINRALSFSRASLIVYGYVLTGKAATHKVWWKDAAYQLRNFSASVIQMLFFTRPWFERKLSLGFSYSSMVGILRQFRKYPAAYNALTKLTGRL